MPGSTMAPVDSIPTTVDVDRIAALSEPVIRNLQITQCYHELAAAMAARVSGANWCTFATWASRQAGQTIRQEDFARLWKMPCARRQSAHRPRRMWRLLRKHLAPGTAPPKFKKPSGT